MTALDHCTATIPAPLSIKKTVRHCATDFHVLYPFKRNEGRNSPVTNHLSLTTDFLVFSSTLHLVLQLRVLLLSALCLQSTVSHTVS